MPRNAAAMIPRNIAMPTRRPVAKQNRKYRSVLPFLIAIALLVGGNASGETFKEWMARLPKPARHFRGADERYWRLWYERGFSPQFAWKNTDPKQVHNFSRPLLEDERPPSR
jgi:hypothetical protein